MDYNFDWDYIKTGSPYVTISTLGISFNNLAIKQLSSPSHVILGFDEKKLTIAVKGVEEVSKSVKSYEFSSRINKDGWIRIGCKEFVQRLENLTGNDFSNAKRFPTSLFNDELLIIEIPVANEKIE